MSENFDEESQVDPADAVEVEPTPPVELTGHARIDDALERLDALDEQEITTHPEVFDTIHRVLRESLASAGRDEGVPDSP
jgi:hypothetical protein